jgi:hypothetical protein
MITTNAKNQNASEMKKKKAYRSAKRFKCTALKKESLGVVTGASSNAWNRVFHLRHTKKEMGFPEKSTNFFHTQKTNYNFIAPC